MNWNRLSTTESTKIKLDVSRMRARSTWLVLCLTLVLAGCAKMTPRRYLADHSLELNTPVASQPSWQSFTVVSGSHAGTIANNLHQAGLIHDAYLFIAWVQVHGLDTSLQAGSYQLCPCMTIPQLATKLQTGLQDQFIITIQEGLRREETAQLLEYLRPGTGADYLRHTGSRTAVDVWRRTFPFLPDTPETMTLEGFLFPDTYHVPDTQDVAEVLVRLQLSRFAQLMLPAWHHHQTGLSLAELVTLASIVERETVMHAERPIVAGVIYNRLTRDMRLEMDTTVVYGLNPPAPGESWWDRTLTWADLRQDHAYNTYVRKGLPPAPIANPGWQSLAAALNPEHHDFLFFVADPDSRGHHRFAVTYAEHLENVKARQR